MAVVVSIDVFWDAPNFWKRVAELASAYRTTDIYIDKSNLLDSEREFLDEQFKKRCENCPFEIRGFDTDICKENYKNDLVCRRRIRWREYR